MDKQQFMQSEAATIIARNGGVDSPDLPEWITNEQKDLYNSLSEEEITSIWAESAFSQYIDPIALKAMRSSNQS